MLHLLFLYLLSCFVSVHEALFVLLGLALGQSGAVIPTEHSTSTAANATRQRQGGFYSSTRLGEIDSEMR